MKLKYDHSGWIRLFNRKYTIKPYFIKRSKLKAGKIVIESQMLRHFIGKQTKVIVYIKRTNTDTIYKK